MHVTWRVGRGNPAAVVLFSWLVLATAGHCRGATGWERLSEELRPGDRITVVMTDHKERSGEFVRVSAENLYLRARTSEVDIERSRISRVTLRTRSRRLRNALIGIGIGVAVALAVDKTVGAYLNNEVGYGAGARALVWGLPIGLGAGLGAATASYPTIYRAK